VSAESGLPTFRGMNGIWQNHRIEEVASPVAWRRDPQMVWEFYSMRREVHAGKKPNAAHLALAELQSRLDGRFFLCTQNVDELHEQAGSENVVHMHGELFKSRCENWRSPGCVQEPFPDRQMYGPSAEIPTCPCGGRLRPHIVWFGEEPFEMARIVAAAERCTLFVAIGTSGLVEPAASLVRIARRRNSGVRSVYVGPEEPANAAEFRECVLAAAAEVLPGLFQIS
jgi:NAD-dependent protein deacetylase/lipoamidase